MTLDTLKIQLQRARNEMSFLTDDPRPNAEGERVHWRAQIIELTKQIEAAKQVETLVAGLEQQNAADAVRAR
jgi:hypothetical protein